MEGFLNLRVRPWLRRLITRSVAIVPAVITVYNSGDQGTYRLLILSQVILSMQLPFAIIPLIRFTSDRSRMGEFANRTWVNILAWGCAVLIIALNFRLAATAIIPWVEEAPWRGWLVVPCRNGRSGSARLGDLRPARPQPVPARHPGAAVATDLPALKYRSILVPLDHSDRDRAAVAHAAAMARLHGATIHLLHVEEGATSQLFGPLASTAEVSSGQEYLEDIVSSLKAGGLEADLRIVHGRSPRAEIIRAAKALQPDLVVMGAHGHTGLKDLIFGTTIDGVRHAVSAAVLVVAEPPA